RRNIPSAFAPENQSAEIKLESRYTRGFRIADVALASLANQLASNTVATPCPCPTHSDARPSFAPESRMRWSRVATMRAPLAPSGWPIAIAPPRVLTLD